MTTIRGIGNAAEGNGAKGTRKRPAEQEITRGAAGSRSHGGGVRRQVSVKGYKVYKTAEFIRKSEKGDIDVHRSLRIVRDI